MNAEVAHTNTYIASSEQRMALPENSRDSEQEILWRRWQEKGRVADRLAERRMKVLFAVIALVLLVWVLYSALRPKVSHDLDRVQRAIRYDNSLSFVSHQSSTALFARASGTT